MGLKRIHRRVAYIVQTVTFAVIAQHNLLRPEATTFLKAYRCHSLVSQNMKTPSTMNCEILNAMGNLFNIIWVNLFTIMDNANNKKCITTVFLH